MVTTVERGRRLRSIMPGKSLAASIPAEFF